MTIDPDCCSVRRRIQRLLLLLLRPQFSARSQNTAFTRRGRVKANGTEMLVFGESGGPDDGEMFSHTPSPAMYLNQRQ